MAHSPLEYKVKYRDIKYPRLEFKTGSLQVVLPTHINPHDIISKHHNWIAEKRGFIEKCLEQSNHLKIINRSDDDFRKIIGDTIRKYANEIKGNVNKIFYRKMRTKWASCSSKRNLTVNTRMQYLPKKQIEYIVYHELTHIYEKKHDDRFWRLISRRHRNYGALESSLFSYWFLINRIVINKRKEL